MATLREYFLSDAREMTVHAEMPILLPTGEIDTRVTSRVHYAFEANAKYLSFYIPKARHTISPTRLVLHNWKEVLDSLGKNPDITFSYAGERMHHGTLMFTGRIFIYSEDDVSAEDQVIIMKEAAALGHSVIFRGSAYLKERQSSERPRAFICHDSRDKSEIAEPLAMELIKNRCPVWFDEYSLGVGDSLRESIEKGLKECHRCVLVITPHFLANSGWTKREFNSIFTREIIESGENLILPIWHNVAAKDVYEYSPVLADRLAVQWSTGLTEVCNKLLRKLNK